MSLFGRVFNATEYYNQTGSMTNTPTNNQDDEKLSIQRNLIEKLSEQLNDATLLSDRRAAAQGLKNFSKQMPQQVGIKTLNSIIQSLQRDALDDQELAQYLISILLNICSDGIFEEILVKDKQIIEIFIQLMINESNSPLLRLDTCQLQSQLAIRVPYRLLDQIMSIPNGPSNIINILNDFNPPLKYQIVSLLSILIQSVDREDFKKLVVFENLFDKLILLITEDGGLELGSVIVENSLHLIEILLQENPTNQKYFESDQSMIWLIDSLNSISRPSKNDPRRQGNLEQSIKVIIALLNPDSPLFPSKQSFLHLKCIDFITKIIENHWNDKEDDSIFTWSLHLLELLQRNNREIQESLSKILIDKQSILSILVFTSLNSQEKRHCRLKCLFFLESFLFKNFQFQENILNTFTTIRNENQNSNSIQKDLNSNSIQKDSDHKDSKSKSSSLPSIGSMIKKATFDRDHRHVLSTKIAMTLISSLIEDNPIAKETLLTVTINDEDDGLYLLDLLFLKKMNHDPISFLSLLIVWINQFPRIVKMISLEGVYIQFLFELILTPPSLPSSRLVSFSPQSFSHSHSHSSSSSPYSISNLISMEERDNQNIDNQGGSKEISSLAAFTIGSLLLYCDEPLKSISSTVIDRIGLELFCTRLAKLKNIKFNLDDLPSSSPSPSSPLLSFNKSNQTMEQSQMESKLKQGKSIQMELVNGEKKNLNNYSICSHSSSPSFIFIISSSLNRIIKRDLGNIFDFIQSIRQISSLNVNNFDNGRIFSFPSIPILKNQIGKLESEIIKLKFEIQELSPAPNLTRQLEHYKNLSEAYFEKMLELERENEDLLKTLATFEFEKGHCGNDENCHNHYYQSQNQSQRDTIPMGTNNNNIGLNEMERINIGFSSPIPHSLDNSVNFPLTAKNDNSNASLKSVGSTMTGHRIDV